jgi:hypothetical protein
MVVVDQILRMVVESVRFLLRLKSDFLYHLSSWNLWIRIRRVIAS